MPENVRACTCDASVPLAAPASSRHDEFYLTDEMTVFQVENRLFRVHRHFLAENSPIFNALFSLPQPRVPNESEAEDDAAPVEGASDENPICLYGVTELEFETLLRFFYKGMHDGFSLPRSRWIVLLSIANHFEFMNVRERAIREIYDPPGKRDKEKSSSTPVPDPHPPDRLTLILTAEKYDVPLQQALPSFVELVMRKEPLTEVEIARLPVQTLHRLARAREEYLRTRDGIFEYRSAATKIVCNIWPAGK